MILLILLLFFSATANGMNSDEQNHSKFAGKLKRIVRDDYLAGLQNGKGIEGSLKDQENSIDMRKIILDEIEYKHQLVFGLF